MMTSALQQLLLQQQSLWWALHAFFLVVFFSLAAWFLLRNRKAPCEQRRRQSLEALPSPPCLPLFGNLLQLGAHAHRSLRSLSEQHGPVMLVRFGSVPTVVVTSAFAAEEVMKTRDLSFASRPTASTPLRLLYDGRDLVFSKYGEYWRQLRRLCVLHLLSNKRVQSFRHVRVEELALLLGRIRRATGPFNLTEQITAFSSNVVCRVAFGKRYSTEAEDGASTRLRQLFDELSVLLGTYAMREYIPLLSWVDWLSGLDGRIKRTSAELDDIVENILEEHHVKNTNKKTTETAASDFVDILMSLEREDDTIGIKLSRESMKALLLDMFAAGTDTTVTLIEWTMAEIITHPEEMKRLQEEVRRVVGPNAEVREEMTERLEYLQAAIKETLRLHPPVPLLVPREAMKDAQVQGYEIPAGTRVIINAWAIGRDPQSWPEEPEEWRPERFLGSNIDFKGQDFQLIPFGAGRRGCPGAGFALVSAELLLASLLYHFDWELPDGKKVETLDMAEAFGLALHKKSNLVVVAKPVH